MVNIFFDFDGTLIDCKARLYNLFQELVPESSFSFEEYCEIKSNRVNQKELLEQYFDYSEDKIQEFKQQWLEKIEDETRLDRDVILAPLNLDKFAQHHTLFLVTNRQSKNRAINQLKKLGIHDYFQKILVTEQKQSKKELIEENINYSSQDIIIGDTGEDIITGKELGIRTFAVETGILKKEILAEYQPDGIVRDIAEFYNQICK